MRLTWENLSSRELELGLPGDDDHPRYVKLEHITDLSGVIERDEHALRMQPLWMREVQMTAMDWHFGNGRITVGTPATLGTLEINAEVTAGREHGTPLNGSVTIGVMDTEKVAVELGGKRFSSDFRIERLHMTQNDTDGGHAALGLLSARNIQTTLGETFIRLDGAVARSTKATWGAASPAVETAGLTVNQLSLKGANIDIDIDIEELELPKGAVYRDGHIEVGELVVSSARVVINDLLTWPRAAGRADADEPAEVDALDPLPQADPDPHAGRMDLRILDYVHGKLDVDVTVDANVPVIGRREATHYFRVPIHDGTINYRELERDLSTLEDAFIDIELYDNRLVLERDIPLLPGRGKPIITWPLNGVEVGLAKKRIVRLRTVPYFHMQHSSDDGGDNKNPAVELRRLRFDDIDIELKLAGQPVTESANSGPVSLFGVAGTIAKLAATGAVHFDPQEPLPSTVVNLVLEQLDGAIRHMSLGPYAADADRVQIEAIEDVSLAFDGFRPRRLEATLKGLRLTNLRLDRA